MSERTVHMFDELNPDEKHYLRLVTTAGLALFAAAAGIMIYRLWLAGQFSAQKWSPLLNPSDKNFTLIWKFLGTGLQATFSAAVASIILSGIAAVGFAAIVYLGGNVTSKVTRGFTNVVRATPLLLIIFFTARILPEYGMATTEFGYLVLALTIFNGAIMAEALRGGLKAVPAGQSEAAAALGLSRWTTFTRVMLPQAVRIVLPVLITQSVVVIQATSLGFIISYEELLRRAQIAVQSLHNPLQLFFVVGCIYVLISIGVARLLAALLLGERVFRMSRHHEKLLAS
ncbi:amino acid ABC transporter permease [Mesorhizobium sp. M0060]|uniref:amino acid ABC transporter permease n=1 Tax=Mesorhizobium sp. M0060 TaxID=2956866 RepID=UPI0033384C88